MSESTPTPTDPREEKPFIPPDILAMSPEKRAQFIEQFNAPLTPKMHPVDDLESTNSNLAAEIAELKIEVTQCDVTIRRREEELATLRAELEAARKEGTEAHRQEEALRYQLDTALAAGWAWWAEYGRTMRRLSPALYAATFDVFSEDRTYFTHANGRNIEELFSNAKAEQERLRAALTPAPTQEPPAGGVTISTEGGDKPCAPHTSNAPACSESTKVPIQTALSTAPGASNSPADVQPEGRGELLPFNLSDALAGKPVVTRDGRFTSKLQGTDRLLGGTVNGIYYNWYLDGKCTNGNPLHDLFMPPTEGSGA